MADRWAVVVGIADFLNPDVAAVPFAQTDAKAVADALGYPPERLVLLLGKHATKAAVESRLRRLKKQVKKGDHVLAVWFGRGNANLLPCWDALADDLPGTSISVGDWVASITGTEAATTAFLFAAEGLADEVADEFDAATVALFAAAAEETSRSAANRGLWSQLVAEAFTGRHRKALTADHKMTARTLQRFLEDELPRRLRKHFDASVSQTPWIAGGGEEIVLAELSGTLAGNEAPLLDPARLRRVVFRSETTTRIKDLSQFRKTFQLPDHAGPGNRKFFARIAAADLKADLDRVYDAAREHLGYKRKDATVVAGTEGYGSLRTPDFEYTVYLDIDEADPTRLLWRREAGQFTDPGFVAGPGFAAVFGATFDHLVFEFAKPVDVADFIDQLEDAPLAGVKVQADADGTGCDVRLAGFEGVVTVRRQAVTVRGRTGGAKGLLDLFLGFVGKFGGVGERLMIGS